jgi:hypothetical protein
MNVDFFVVFQIVLVIQTISGISLARIFTSRIGMAVLRSVLVLEV